MHITIANQLFNSGALSEMFKAGFISSKIFTYREIYLWVEAQMQTQGISKNKAVFEAQGHFKKDERTIWRAINSFSGTDTMVSPL
ncbi:hypothetical protein [Mucilaginibacter terrae]|uniref:Uncharacterized protein n=1 Tax=Mucilaginibacter terrae TaxID=1955052 RepID=A0ABU3GZB5_9SPHI|nr:hypothetical protein [Mucilaginibacter terrae]MDT3405103.1 hypothetical protein [Mucilaginibacter terrae]